MARITVVGGGYAGVLAALRLGRRGHAVTLVDPGDGLVERIRLHEALVGAPIRVHPYAGLLGGRATHRRARLLGLDGTTARLDDGALPADAVLLALGSVADDPLPGPVIRLHGAVPTLRGAVAVVGAGWTGVEAAAELAAAGRAVTLIGPAVDLGDDGRIAASLARLGVTRVDGRATEAVPGGVVVDGALLRADHVVSCGGLRPHPLLAQLGEITPDGALRVDAGLAVREGVWAAGDAAAALVAGRRLRAACATAMPLGAHAADALDAALSGREPPALDFGYAARCVSLGRHDGALIQVDPLDRPLRSWAGRGAAWVKEAICRYTVLALRAERLGVRYRWPAGPGRRLEEATA